MNKEKSISIRLNAIFLIILLNILGVVISSIAIFSEGEYLLFLSFFVVPITFINIALIAIFDPIIAIPTILLSLLIILSLFVLALSLYRKKDWAWRYLTIIFTCFFFFSIISSFFLYLDYESFESWFSKLTTFSLILIFNILPLVLLISVKDYFNQNLKGIFIKSFIVSFIVVFIVGLMLGIGMTPSPPRDAGNIAELSGLRASAELYASDRDNGYEGFCDSADNVYSKDSLTVKDNFLNQRKSTILHCDSSETQWAACAQLVSKGKENYYFCVDSMGNAVEREGTCKPLLVCP